MKDIRILTAAAVLFSLCSGALTVSTPQVILHLNLPPETLSRVLGIVGAGNPIGYALACLLYGRIFDRYTGKYVVLGGLLASAGALLLMSQAHSPGLSIVAQLTYGMATGAFWPFISAWMLDFQSAEISKTRILRHYNVGWTSGSAVAQFAAGYACQAGYIYETLYAAAAVALVACAMASLAKATHHSQLNGASATSGAVRRLGWPILAAAVLALLIALGTRMTIVNNYAELNSFLHFGAERMGLFSALMVLVQCGSFGLGHYYEKWLGLRRAYLLIAVVVVLTSLTFAWTTNLSLLVGAVVLNGLALAMTFQGGIVAATSCFSRSRTGTTFHESIVGLTGLFPLCAGQFIGSLKRSGVDELTALRMPYFCLAAGAIVVLLLQCGLISLRNHQRRLL